MINMHNKLHFLSKMRIFAFCAIQCEPVQLHSTEMSFDGINAIATSVGIHTGPKFKPKSNDTVRIPVRVVP